MSPGCLPSKGDTPFKNRVEKTLVKLSEHLCQVVHEERQALQEERHSDSPPPFMEEQLRTCSHLLQGLLLVLYMQHGAAQAWLQAVADVLIQLHHLVMHVLITAVQEGL